MGKVCYLPCLSPPSVFGEANFFHLLTILVADEKPNTDQETSPSKMEETVGQIYDATIIRRRLKDMAYRIRQEAIQNGDLESWRIARIIRDASTTEQIKEAERRLQSLRRD